MNPDMAPDENAFRSRGASELRQSAVNGDFAGCHEAAVRGREKGSPTPISAGSAMRWSGVMEAKILDAKLQALKLAHASPAQESKDELVQPNCDTQSSAYRILTQNDWQGGPWAIELGLVVLPQNSLRAWW